VTNCSPVLATAAGLVFGGMDRYLRTHDDADGKILRQTRLAAQALGFTYAVNGRHMVRSRPAGLRSRARCASLSTDATTGGNAVYVFAPPH
jgi:hypothetical protein